MKHFIPALAENNIKCGKYEFKIVDVAVIDSLNILHVVYRLYKPEEVDFRAYIVQDYKISLNEKSDYYKLIENVYIRTYYDFAMCVDTDQLIGWYGGCTIKRDRHKRPFVDIDSIDVWESYCTEVDMSEADRYIF